MKNNLKVIDVGENPRLVIESVQGDLIVSGWNRSVVAVESENEDQDNEGIHISESDQTIKFTCSCDLTLRVPRSTSFTIGQVDGDARLKSIDGDIHIQSVAGDLQIVRIHKLHVDDVGGDLSVKNVSGDLYCSNINGDATIRGVEGKLELGLVAGDIYVKDAISGTAISGDGDASINIRQIASGDFKVDAGGDITCRLAPDVGVNIHLMSDSSSIAINLPGEQKHIDSNSFDLILGDGKTPLRLSARGDVSLSSYSSSDWDPVEDVGYHFGEKFGAMAEEIADQVTHQIDTQMGIFENGLEERLAHLRIPHNLDKDLHRARVKIQKAARKVKAATRRAERKSQAAKRSAEHRTLFHSMPVWDPAKEKWSVETPTTEHLSVSNEEKLAILKMVEQGKISVTEAETLFDALEGK